MNKLVIDNDVVNKHILIDEDADIEINLIDVSRNIKIELMPGVCLRVFDKSQNTKNIIEYAVKQGIKMIILTNGIQIKEEHLKIAKENKVNIISTNYNTFSVSQKISLCNYISTIEVDKNVTYVYENDELNDFIELANRTKFSNYPVLNKNNKCLGVIRLADASEKNILNAIKYLIESNKEEDK